MPGRSLLLRAAGALLLVLACGFLAWILVSRATGDEPASRSPAPTPDLAVVSPGEVRAALADGAIPIDVRTEKEFAAGHLEGARNIAVDAADFEQKLSPLDPEAGYVVYCASGRRAASAIERMESAGFTDLLNGGGYDDLVADGLAPSAG